MGKHKFTIPKNLSKIIEVIVVILLTTVIFCLIYKNWILNFSIPIKYQGDVTYTLSSIKTISEKGWFYETNRLGTPFKSNNLDYSSPENLLYFSLKIINLFTKNIFLTLNIFYYFTFITTALTTFYVFKYFKLNKTICLVGSQLFAFTPYHLIRGESHLFLSTYFIIPLIFLISYWIFSNTLNRFRIVFSSIVILITASIGVYYAFFSSFFILISSFISFINKKYKSAIISLLFIFLMFFGLFINLLPNLIYSYQNGKNSLVANRNPNESEYYGLKISTLFVPNSDYNIKKLKNIIINFKESTYLKSENGNYLGVIGILGFILLLINLFTEKNKKNKLILLLTYFNISAILLAVNFGFGSIFAYLITAKIRAYQRICIFIYFFSLFYFCYLINLKYKKSKLFYILGILILLIGIIDQSSLPTGDYFSVKSEFDSDNQIIKNIENNFPDSMVFQLPYKEFPESNPINLIIDYDLLKPYIFSKTIKWTHGNFKGTGEDRWYKSITESTTNQLLNKLCLADFSGILINRQGYSDNGNKLEKEISFEIPTNNKFESQNKKLVFYSLENCKQDLKINKTKDEINKIKNNILKPNILEIFGCYKKENLDTTIWQWCQNNGSFNIKNYSNQSKNVKIQFQIDNSNNKGNITFYNKQYNQNFQINKNKNLELNIQLNPGLNKLNFKYYGSKIKSNTDTRIMFFKLKNIEFNNDSNIFY